MTALPMNFHSSGHEAQTFEPVPAGSYPMMIVQDEMRTNSSGSGEHLYMVLQITDGPYKGRQIYERLNLINSNDKAVTIALGTLASMTRAILGHDADVRDTSILHMRPFLGRVGIRPGQGTFGPSNNVTSHSRLDLGSSRLGPPTPPPQPQQQPQHSFNPAGNPFPQGVAQNPQPQQGPGQQFPWNGTAR